MKFIKLNDFCFYDFMIRDISYKENTLTLDMPNTPYEDSLEDLKLEMTVDEDDLSIYYLKRYPRLHNVKLKGKEISFCTLKSFLEKGYALQIEDFFVSANMNAVFLECEIFPYSAKRGVAKKIVFKLNYEHDYLILKQTTKVEK